MKERENKIITDEEYSSAQYRQILRISQMTMNNELRREDSLLIQASHMQTAFAFTTAAIFTVLPVCIEYKGALPYVFFYVWIAIIISFMLASLVCASIAQWRFKTKTYESVENIESVILDDLQWKMYVQDSYCDAQIVKMLQDIYAKNNGINEKRVKFIIASMVCFFSALISILLCFVRATVLLGSFEGVYIANRTNFEEKSYYLINKNARRLTTLSNIRGFLMDQTSENDYTIKSYILRNFSKLSMIQQKEITEMLLDFIKKKVQNFDIKANDEIIKLETKGIGNINQTMKMMDELFPIKLKYEVFEKMVGFLAETEFEEVTVQQYIDEIIKARNTLAHKKLDVCKTQKYIKYYDTINQFEDRQCPEDCGAHSDDNKYSLEQWDTLRKKVQKFGKSIDIIQGKL